MKEIFYDWGGVNVALFHAINDIHNAVLDQVMLFGTAIADHNLFPFYLSFFVLLALMVPGKISDDPVQRHRLMHRWLSVVAVFSIAYMLDGVILGYLKPILDFPRPPLALPPETVHIVGEAEYHHSFPSGHSSFAMLVTATLWPVLRRNGRFMALLLMVWVGLSRISLGAHFPADVIGGFSLSLAVVLVVRGVVEKLAPPAD